MKKILIILFIFVLMLIVFLFYNTKIFKIYNLTNETNNLNSNLPYLKYNFENVNVYKGINNNYMFWYVEGYINNNINEKFEIKEAYNIKSRHYLYYQDFNENKIEFFGYRFLLFLKPYLREDNVMVYNDKSNIYIGLWNINDFLDIYLRDKNYPENRNYKDIKENLDYIPHVMFPLK